MRRFISIFLVVVMVMSSATFAFGDVSMEGTQNQTNNQAQNVGQNVGVTTTLSPSLNSQMNSTNTNYNNSSSNSSSTSDAQSSSSAEGGDAKATGGNSVSKLSNNYVVPIQPYSPSVTVPMSPGQAAPNTAWMLYMGTVLDCLTYEEAKNLSEDFFWNRAEVSVMVKGLAVTSSIRILDYYGKKPGDKVVGFARVFGKKKDITESLVGLAGKEGMEKGANAMGVMIRVKNRTNSKGVSFGVGAGAGLYVPCNNGVGTGVSFGAFLSSVAIEDEIELTVVYLVTCEPKPCPPPPPAPPTPAPEPEKPQTCNPKEFMLKLERAEMEIFGCKRYSHNNLYWQLEAMKESLNVYLCTGNATFLEDAIQHGQMAELNYLHGHDIAKYADSDKIVGEVEYLLASAFYARDSSINNFWKAPAYVVHVDKKRGNSKPVALTSHEKKQVEKLRCTLERYSKKLAL